MPEKSILSLDVGEKRIGVAIAGELRFARPLKTLENNGHIWQELAELIQEHGVTTVVVGLPRGLDGQSTAQTRFSEDFMEQVRVRLNVTVHAQDEAGTSLKAEAELAARGKPYEKSDIDALAATYILEDYLMEPGT